MTADVSKIIDYEQGELDLVETLDLFGDLIKSGLAWSLQGSYGRTARSLIEQGYLTPDGEVIYDPDEEWAEATSHPSYWSNA